jgi:acetyl-CoA decarbonylase/synthase complex subunit gamma
MPLSGLQIYKLLPKTNCKECGFPTCLAFAMKLAAKQAELESCPYVSEEAKAKLAAASRPPMRLITVGSGENKIEVGNETELFRHDRTFYHGPGLMVRVKDTQPIEEIEETVSQVDGYSVELVGMTFGLNGIALENASGEANAYLKALQAVQANTDLPLILMAKDPEVMAAALNSLGDKNPLLYAATEDNWSDMVELAKKHECPLAVYGMDGLNELAGLVEKVEEAGLEDIVLDPGTRGLYDSLSVMTQIRRLALKKNFRPFGYPIITFPGEGADSIEKETILAGQHIAKYGGFIVLDHFDPAEAYPLITLRLNIYTDPREPIQMEPGVYEFGEPTADSPLFTTTNFSLTYFSVASEIEASGVPSWLLVTDSEGMSVLTAWAAGHFDSERIAKDVKKFGVADKISHRKIIIPGLVAVIMGETEEELGGEWEVMVGPKEAIEIPRYLEAVWK